MHRRLLLILACPSCRVGFECVAHAEKGDRVESGFLRCPRCAIVVPVLDGLVMFTEPLLHAGQATAGALAAMAQRLFGSGADFAGYRGDRRLRGVVEAYAAFAPFNESTRTPGPLLPHALPALRAGDAVLDTWCRTGWSGEWLAGRLPAQHVVSLWEGNSSVLGYRGFRHLLGSDQRAGNLDIVFCSLEKPLPFHDAAFGLVHAYDSLHRYGLVPFAGECLRVAREDAAVLFPHLHLSNSEPEPFFERGCRQWHGRDYRDWLQRLELGPARRGWVLSEAAVFDGPAVARLQDDADTPHYNGIVAILPVVPPRQELVEAGGDRFIPSPLFAFHLGRASARVGKGLFDGAVGHLLQRHPVYEARLPEGNLPLGEPGILALLLATLGYQQSAMEAAMGPVDGGLPATLEELCGSEILVRAPVSLAGHRLQRFHANQWPVREEGALAAFWASARICTGSLLQLPGGESLAGAQVVEFSAAVCRLLKDEGLRPGQRISVAASAHPLLLLAAFAAASAGYEVSGSNAALAPADADFVLAGDGDVLPPGVRGLPLGLGSAPDSLLARLAPGEIGMQGHLDECGVLVLDLGGRVARCRPSDLVEALDSLSAQIESQYWLHEGKSSFLDLLSMIAAWQRGECLRAL